MGLQKKIKNRQSALESRRKSKEKFERLEKAVRELEDERAGLVTENDRLRGIISRNQISKNKILKNETSKNENFQSEKLRRMSSVSNYSSNSSDSSRSISPLETQAS